MSLFDKLQLLIAAHRDAVLNYETLAAIEDAASLHEIYPKDNAELVGAVEQAFDSREVMAQIVGKTLAMMIAERLVTRGVLIELIKEADEVKKPNGTTRKLRRIAAEGLAVIENMSAKIDGKLSEDEQPAE